ncbi:MAG: hypothetical protein QNK04_32975 [Myxococcota bacterium]|nr:hypothetical protein [Myxococcota bacterium]
MQTRALLHRIVLLLVALATAGCWTLAGAAAGNVIGGAAGNAEMGTAVGATAGVMLDIFDDDYY